MSAARFDIDALPLFPLHAVLFPGGLLRLKVFEPRYLDLISRCLRDDETFGVVCLRQGAEVREPVGAEPVRFERVGVLARLQSVDAERPGILELSCVGTQRFQISSPRQQRDGLWLADAVRLDEDPATAPVDGLARTVDALSKAIESLQFRGQRPFLEPYRLNDAGWVASRWCEILPISLVAKQKLMELNQPLQRLRLVDDFLRSKGVV